VVGSGPFLIFTVSRSRLLQHPVSSIQLDGVPGSLLRFSEGGG
jgi:hypothetical protein